MKEWELARYLIDCKKDVDSVWFVSKNIEKLSHFNLREKIDSKLQHFYITIRGIYDDSLSISQKKIFSTKDEVYMKTRYEADKNYAHKDKNYISTEYKSLFNLVDLMKERLNHCKEICKSKLPDSISLDYVAYDRDLFRLLYSITKSKEEKIKALLHFNFEKSLSNNGKVGTAKNVFYDTEDLHRVTNSGDYAVVLEDGLTIFEELQNQQDWAIKMNVLFGRKIWVAFNGDGNGDYIEKFVEVFQQMKII